MDNEYNQVNRRFLRDDERLILSEEKEMPLVIEATTQTDAGFLQQFLASNSAQLLQDMAKYGAVLLRGFDVNSDEQFEKTIVSVPEFRGISDAFMAENGRIRVDHLKYVLQTNAVYKTGGTLYLGGFHTENYYSPDVPSYIFFYCAKPSEHGGETGIINTHKIYQSLDSTLQQKIENTSFFVSQWLVKEVAERYGLEHEKVKKIAEQFNLPLVGKDDNSLLLMYKPSVFIHPLTKEKALQINLFELPTLNKYLRKCFKADYKGRQWFWHRFFWSLPNKLFCTIEFLAITCIAFFHSPKNAYKMMHVKLVSYFANKKINDINQKKVGSIFTQKDIKDLAQAMRSYYCSCLWKKGDILLIDNRKVMHAGMPGKGARLIRAMISNPIMMDYTFNEAGVINVQERKTPSMGEYVNNTTFLGD